MQDWDRQNPTQIVTEMCGFVTILSGTFLLHKTKDMVDGGFMSFSWKYNKIIFCFLNYELMLLKNWLHYRFISNSTNSLT